ncbi:SDR family NAD(P)-dependent oxidoreductase [Flavobacterium arcticum]|uniref:SDR family NAD(P)-dependent oxidoreductase n=1 Tax=Flavobacterium arcticum TaxID=1784713 RepID=A0A345HEF0_9FLAO|nr:glucose 1-dehydrogenase [Flavobacterium arcticum]AXG74960.1 SDR family NAD(P)-dependent oxidoreductase [Flavobacterium arcticum]KAF2506513.1 glucose 1-dehydrogenase [Flavobacterium arcticum]
MNLKLDGKVAVVTGASKGIGSAIAKSLAAAGAAVAVNYANSKEGANIVVNQIIADGGKAFAVQGDVSNQEDVIRIFEETKKALGGVDILVNNAGVYKFLALEEITSEELYTQFNINVLGSLLAAKEAVKHFPESGGNIINISSVVSTAPTANSSIYSGTKGAIDTITKALAIELAPKNIRVNAIAPGLVQTEGTETAGIKGSELEASIISTTPLARAGQPNDIARVAVFLASEDSAWVTGEIITASGGL